MKIKGFSIRSKFRLLFGVLLALTLCPSSLFAQITASSASYQSKTQYTTGSQDDIFVYCDEANVGVGELKAVSPDGTSGWDFTWMKWDSGTNSFSIFKPTESSLSESTISNLENGLYQVVIEKGAETNTYQAWVINHLRNTNKPTFSKKTMDCVGVHFDSSYQPEVYQYFDIPSNALLDIPNTSVFSFVRDGIELQRITFADYDGSSKNFIDEKAFENDADYNMTVIDQCGFEYVSDLVVSPTYVVDATFTFTPTTGEAPLEVSCETQNANATEYQWHFYQDYSRIDGPVDTRDSLLIDLVNEKDTKYTYLHPGGYFIKLIAQSDKGPETCVDVYQIPNEIIVEGSIFEVPNVFTPNGDGANDEFRLRLYSVKSYSVKIFNRWGRLVYEFEESDVSPGLDNRKSSKGWDGKISGKLATPGTYFYVVEAEGREEEGKHYTEKGALTLLHNK